MRLLAIVTLLLDFLVTATLAAHTLNYNTLVAAATKKNKQSTIQVGKSYLMIGKKGPDIRTHDVIIVGTVQEDGHGNRDFAATMTQLTKDDAQLSGEPLPEWCSLVGNLCTTMPKQVFKCPPSSCVQRYVYKGEVSPEFADPETFRAWGKHLSPSLVCMNYDLLTHVCYSIGNLLVQRTGGYNIL